MQIHLSCILQVLERDPFLCLTVPFAARSHVFQAYIAPKMNHRRDHVRTRTRSCKAELNHECGQSFA
jgi:hypothetical protein